MTQMGYLPAILSPRTIARTIITQTGHAPPRGKRNIWSWLEQREATMQRNGILATLFLVALFGLFGVIPANSTCGRFIDRGGYTVLRNFCSQTVTIRWRDQGHCRTGCAATVGAGREQTVTSPRGSWTITSEE